jgi:hypothetical protein
VPGNTFPAYYTTISIRNSGIRHPVLIDVVSGDIRPIDWKSGTTDTLESLPVTDSIMAIADADYFDWPVLPEAPSSLIANWTSSGVKLSWQVHGGDPQRVLVERRDDSKTGRSDWEKIEELPSSAKDYTDSQLKGARAISYRVRAKNSDGESAASNTVRMSPK